MTETTLRGAHLLPPAGSVAGLDHVRALTTVALDALRDVAQGRKGPVRPGGPEAARDAVRQSLRGPLLPAIAGDPVDTFRQLVTEFASWSVDLSHPAAVARMQCPPTPVAAAAELVVAVLNQSLHAWESGPYALELERYVISELAAVAGYGPGSGGTITAGGSISNLMAVLLARDTTLARRLGRQPFSEGLAAMSVRPVVLATDATHFSIGRAVGIVGLGEDTIVRVPSDALGRLHPEALENSLRSLPADAVPVMIVACAGATDQGWVDDLVAIAEVAHRHGIWLHADAAYGGGMLFSPRLRSQLAGLAEADSITMDLHKFGWMPATAGVFLLRRAADMASLAQRATTLNAADDVEEGYVGLYRDSVQATRRAEAFKIAATLAVLGSDGMAEMVEGCCDLARYAAARIATEPRLQLAAEPSLSTVLFRYRPVGAHDVDAFNGLLRRHLMAEGIAVLARSRVRQPDDTSPVFLKLMLLNPATTTAELDQVIDQVIAAASLLESAGRIDDEQ